MAVQLLGDRPHQMRQPVQKMAFAQEIQWLHLKGLERHLLFVGDEHDRGLHAELTRVAGQIDAVELGHVDVEEQHIVPCAAFDGPVELVRFGVCIQTYRHLAFAERSSHHVLDIEQTVPVVLADRTTIPLDGCRIVVLGHAATSLCGSIVGSAGIALQEPAAPFVPHFRCSFHGRHMRSYPRDSGV